MDLEHKSLNTEAEIKDADKGIVSAYVSVTGVIDMGNDVIEPGAFMSTLSKRMPKVLANHDWGQIVGKTLVAREVEPGARELPRSIRSLGDAGALYVEGQFNLKSARGRDAFEDVKFFGGEQEYSIGYLVPPGMATKGAGAPRRIHGLELYEWSMVPFGMNVHTRTAGVKAAVGSPHGIMLTRKSMTYPPGSFEEMTEALGRAVAQALPARTYGYPIATFESTVVVAIHADEGGQTEYHEYPYSLNDAGEPLLGTPRPVRVDLAVTPVEAEGAIKAAEPLISMREFWNSARLGF